MLEGLGICAGDRGLEDWNSGVLIAISRDYGTHARQCAARQKRTSAPVTEHVIASYILVQTLKLLSASGKNRRCRTVNIECIRLMAYAI